MRKSPFISLSIALAWLALWPGQAFADDLEIRILGVKEPALSNVEAAVEPFRLTGIGRLTRRRMENLRRDSEVSARKALRPYGYYHANVKSTFERTGERSWRMDISVEPGPAVVISDAQVEVNGPGALFEELIQWQADWPLRPGQVLVQPTWDSQKQLALDIAANQGFFLAAFTQHEIKVDLEKNEARLKLVMETGPRAVMGEVRFHQDVVKPRVLQNMPRFRPGDPYDSWLMERFRIDVWRSGYFGTIEILEDRHLDENPPRVDLDVHASARPLNTYQGQVGIGSDTGARVQFSWNRHLLSSNGDNFTLGTGWQDHNDEFYVRGAYRIPRNVETRQFWIADALLKREHEDLLVQDDDFDDELIGLGNVDIEDYSLKPGRLRIYDLKLGYWQVFETIYAQALKEKVSYSPRVEDALESRDSPGDINGIPLSRSSRTLSLGIDYDLPFSRGQGFGMVGTHTRAWAFISNEAWGSDRDFSQVYLSSRWHFRLGERWKFLLRGEIGYSDARVNDLIIEIGESPLELSVTELPNLYRFKAGGSSSVRGYGFERLSTNNIGSNNIVTASVEAEYRILQNWSVAAFTDVGNAFNDWGEMDLKTGIGFGVRWYSIAGAVRVDVAQGLDLPGQPWRIHFTIGTPLL